ncbi:DUF421 domain-containing protein [Neobacillus mesonae]|nr:DUF421 domain-containing protein [Neobacillus mesonae]
MLFSSWDHIVKIVITCVLGYTSLIILLRLAGKRSLSNLSAFDLVITVSIGSILSTMILDSNVTFTDGLIASAILVGLQTLVARLTLKSPFFHRVFKAAPTLLYYQGDYLRDEMKSSKLMEDDILQIVRSEGVPSMNKVEAVVLERDGSLSIIKKSDQHHDTLSNV